MPKLEALTLVDKVAIDRDGIISVRLQYMRIMGSVGLSAKYHAFAMMPGDDPEMYFREVAAHLAEMGEGKPDEDTSWSKVRRWQGQFHTSDEVDRYKERRRRRLLREDPDADFDGTIVFQCIGALYKTPASPPGRIDRVVAARPVMVLAGRSEPASLGNLAIAPGESIDSKATLDRYVVSLKLAPTKQKSLSGVIKSTFGANLNVAEANRIKKACEFEHSVPQA